MTEIEELRAQVEALSRKVELLTQQLFDGQSLEKGQIPTLYAWRLEVRDSETRETLSALCAEESGALYLYDGERGPVFKAGADPNGGNLQLLQNTQFPGVELRLLEDGGGVLELNQVRMPEGNVFRDGYRASRNMVQMFAGANGGALALSDENDHVQAVLNGNTGEGGSLQLNNGEGETLVNIDARHGAGSLSLSHQGFSRGVVAWADDQGAGALEVRHGIAKSEGDEGDEPEEAAQARCKRENEAQIGLYAGEQGGSVQVSYANEDGQVRLHTDEQGGGVVLCDAAGEQRGYFVVEREATRVLVKGKDSEAYTALMGDPQTPAVLVCGPDGELCAQVACNSEGEAVIALHRDSDTVIGSLAEKNGRGAFMLADDGGQLRVLATATEHGADFTLWNDVAPSEEHAALLPDSFRGDSLSRAFHLATNENGARLQITSPDGTPRFQVDAGESGTSVAATQGGGAGVVRLAAVDEVPPSVLIFGDDGKLRAHLTATEDGALFSLLGPDAAPAIAHASGPNGGAILVLRDNSKPIVALGRSEESAGVSVMDENGQVVATLQDAPEGGALSLRRSDAELGAQLSAREEGGTLELFSANGEIDVSLPATSE